LKNQTWDLVPQPQGKSVVKCLLIYKTKFTSYGVVECHKSRLASKGLSQQEFNDYTKTFAHVAKMNSNRLIISLVVCFGWEIHQMDDLKSASLHGDFSKDIYMEQPPSFVKYSSLVCQLKKSLYGLKQVPQA